MPEENKVIIFRGKYHSERIADALLYSEQMAAYNELKELERDFNKSELGQTIDTTA